MEYLGCGAHDCVIEKPKGQGTNGGCSCLKMLKTEDRIKIERCLCRLRQRQIEDDTIRFSLAGQNTVDVWSEGKKLHLSASRKIFITPQASNAINVTVEE